MLPNPDQLDQNSRTFCSVVQRPTGNKISIPARQGAYKEHDSRALRAHKEPDKQNRTSGIHTKCDKHRRTSKVRTEHGKNKWTWDTHGTQ